MSPGELGVWGDDAGVGGTGQKAASSQGPSSLGSLIIPLAFTPEMCILVASRDKLPWQEHPSGCIHGVSRAASIPAEPRETSLGLQR